MAYVYPLAGAARETLTSAGAPGAGTDEIQTLTFGGTPTGGTFKIKFRNQTTAAITWSATNNTLVANIDAALGAIASIGGASNVTTAVGTMTAGVGTITVTFVAALAKLAVALMTVANNSLTGTSPTFAITETTPGVTAAGRGAIKGQKLIDSTNGVEYISTSAGPAPTWVVVGAQS